MPKNTNIKSDIHADFAENQRLIYPKNRLLLCFALGAIFASCATTQQNSTTTSNRKSELPLPHVNTREESFNDNLDADAYSDNAAVQKWIAYYSTDGKKHLEDMLRRGSMYKKHIHAILQKFELPTNLYYLALIESDFKVNARSPAQASGLWQFMAPTARNYGLRINSFIDERQDPWRSTVAAALYLRNLNNVFDSWFLALSAYNAGESRVMNAILRSGTRDYWKLCDIGFLPRETRAYVPRFIAALIVAEHPEHYGLRIRTSDAPNLTAVEVPSPVHLDKIARRTGISLQEIKSYNPHILKNITPPHSKYYRVWLPEGRNYTELAQLEPISLAKLFPKKSVHKHKRKKSKSILVTHAKKNRSLPKKEPILTRAESED